MKASSEKVNYGSKEEDSREGIVKNLKFLGVDGELIAAGNSGQTPSGAVKGKEGGGGSKNQEEDSEKSQYPERI